MAYVKNGQHEDILVGLEEGPKGQGPAIHDTIIKPLFEGSTLSNLFATLLILNCYHTHGTFNAFIIVGVSLKKTSYPPQIHCHHQNMKFHVCVLSITPSIDLASHI
jgi:hypothetical protein